MSISAVSLYGNIWELKCWAFLWTLQGINYY